MKARNGRHFFRLSTLNFRLSTRGIIWVPAVLPALALAGTIDVPIVVPAPPREALRAFPVTLGVSLPRGEQDAAKLGVVDAEGRPVPAQVRELVRWPDGTLRFVLVDVVADVPAGRSATLRLVAGAPAAPAAPIAARRDGEDLVVETGALRATFDAASPLPALEGPGAPALHLTPESGAALRLVARGPPELEETGPLRAVVRTRGAFLEPEGDAPFLDLTVRAHFFAGRPDLRLFLTLENPRPYGFEKTEPGHRHFRSLALRWPLPGEGPAQAAIDRWRGPVEAGRALRVVQARTDGVFDVQLALGGAALRRPGARRMDDVFTITRGAAGLTAGLRFPWQNAPVAATLAQDGLALELLPPEGSGPAYDGGLGGPPDERSLLLYRFEGGRHKTWEVALRAHGSNATAAARAAVDRLLHPPAAHAEPGAAAASGAFGFPFPPERGWSAGKDAEPALAAALQRMERWKRVLFDPRAADPEGRTIEGLREKRPKDAWGWFHFGDLPWADGTCSNHYDWPATLLVGFARTGDGRALEEGIAHARHRIDIDQYHAAGDVSRSGGQFYEKGLCGSRIFAPKTSHTWVRGPLLYGLLTGDARGFEAAREVGAFLLAATEHWDRSSGEWRVAGWTLMNFCDLWRFTGDARYLEAARRLAREVGEVEARFGGKGWFLSDTDWGYKGETVLFQTGILMNALADYLDEAGADDAETRALFLRMADWLLAPHDPPGNHVIRGGTGPPEAYVPWQVRVDWRPGADYGGPGRRYPGSGGNDPVHNLWVIDPLAAATRLSGDARYLEAARRLFGDTVRWFGQGGPVDQRDRAALTPITCTLRTFPGSETKVLGWMGRLLLRYAAEEERRWRSR